MNPFRNPVKPCVFLAILYATLFGFSALHFKPAAAAKHGGFHWQPQPYQSKTSNMWRRSGPEGGTAQVLAFHPTNPAIMFAGGSGGLFRSTDGGVNWTESETGMTNFALTTIAFSPSNPQVMYAGTYASFSYPQVFKSLDGGTTWVPANQGIPYGNCERLIVHPQNPNILYLVGADTVYKSTDGAASWTAKTVPITASTVRSSLVIDPLTPETLYVTSHSRGVYKSVNGGETWTNFSTGLTLDLYGALAIDPANPATLYLGYYLGGVAKSTNGGLTWSLTGLEAGGITSLAVDPQSPNRVYAGTHSLGLLKTENGGTGWTPLNNGLPQNTIPSVAIFPGNPTQLLLSTTGYGVYKSINAGGNWTAASHGLFLTYASAVAIHPTNPDIVYSSRYDGALGTGGIVKSTDGTQTWTELDLPGRYNIYSLAIHPTNPNISKLAVNWRDFPNWVCVRSFPNILSWETFNEPKISPGFAAGAGSI